MMWLPLALALPMADIVEIPSGWIVRGRSDPSAKLEMHFAVKQRRLEALQSKLLEVSDPRSAQYGMHMSNKEVHELVAPSAGDLESVRHFIFDAVGRPPFDATPNGDMLGVVVTIAEAETMLNAEYHELEHLATGVRGVHRCVRTGYRIPDRVAAALDMIVPTTHVPGVHRNPATNKTTTYLPHGGVNVPKTLRSLYSINTTVEGKAPANKMAVTAFLGQHYSKLALERYWNEYCKDFKCGPPDGTVKTVGDAVKGMPGVESMLDIEAITGVAGNVEAEFWGFAGKSPDDPSNEPFMKWLSTLSSTSDADVPKLFSTSYGEDEASWSYEAAKRLNAEFMKAGARGISLLYASGDEGANCKRGKFVPETPGSSPFVTAVGGTKPASGYPDPGGEAAVYLSSGGFSNYWRMPDWQQAAVHNYLTSGKDLPPPSVGYNVSGRAYPDISAQAANFCVTPFGCGVAGTSCASPTAAGVFALLNDLRLQAGKPTLGFLNPFIYQNADSFNDITSGQSEGGCTTDGGGWPAASGWDAVTGVGTPNYEKLAQAVLSLP